MRLDRDGWRLDCYPLGAVLSIATIESLEATIAGVLAAARGTAGEPIRRSRHAVTYLCAPGDGQLFVKTFERPSGIGALKRVLRRQRIGHIVRISGKLAKLDFRTPEILMVGEEPESGRSLIVTRRAEGDSLADAGRSAIPIARKRALLDALGAEVARLHGARFIHGDLTPYNVFTGSDGSRLTLIDHDRTRRTLAPRPSRRELRNLVQLGRFDLPGLTRTDRVRVLRAYAAKLGFRKRNSLLRRVNRMLKARLARDRRALERSKVSRE